MATSDLGKVRPYFRGDYYPTTEYEFFDCAKFNSVWWLCKNINGCTGVAPEEGDDWTTLSLVDVSAFETFELDIDGDLMPKENPSGSQYFNIDSDGDICPNG